MVDRFGLSIYGANGFVGTHYRNKFGGVAIDRGVIEPYSNDILFLASTTDNYNLFKDIEVDIRTNEILPLQVLEVGRQKFGKDFTFNYVSSWFVYGDTLLPAIEDSKCDPEGFYAITRLAGERLVRSYCTTFGIKYRILRLCNIIGVGDTKASLKKNALQYLISKIVKGERVSIYKEPSYRDFMDVRDCVRAIHTIIKSGRYNEIFNVGTGASYNVRQLLESLDDNGVIEYMDVPEFHKQVQVRKFSMDVSKLQSLGFEPEYSLSETINWVVEHYKNER